MGAIKELNDLGQWPKMRQSIETSVNGVLGKMPAGQIDLQLKVIDEMEFGGYIRRRVNYFVDEWTRVTAWMFVPEGDDEKPAVLCCHGRNAMGKDEMAGLEGGDPNLAFARHYAERGYVTLAPDCATAGERIFSKSGPFETKSFYKEHPKMTLMGRMLWDHMRCVDLLSDHKDIDPARIGVIGHGLGGANALMLAAFDDRVRAVVASSGFTMFSGDPNPGRWVEDEGCALLPTLAAGLKKGQTPFEWDEILALIAPNPTLLITPLNDESLPNAESCDKAVAGASAIYALLGAKNALANKTHKGGPGLPLPALDAADEWLDRWL